MILDVDLVKNQSIYCKESALATVANYLNRDYRMMFMDMFGFDYLDNKNGNDQKIGDRMISGVSMRDVEEILREYHGIAAENKIVHDIEKTVKEQIDQKTPVLLYLSPVFCEWTGETDGVVFFLAIGYDDSYAYGYDLHSDSSSVEKIHISDLIKCYETENEVQLYTVVSEEKSVSIENIKESMSKYYIQNGAKEKIYELAEDLSENYVEEFKGEEFDEMIDLPFFAKLIDVVRGKKLFVDTCYYVFEKSNDEFAKYIGDHYMDIGEQWNAIWKTLTKFYILNCDDDQTDGFKEIISDIVDSLKNVADEEQKLIENALGNAEITERIIRWADKIAEDDGYEYYDVDLSPIFDNKGFYEAGSDIFADLTGSCEYFVDGVLGDDRTIPIGKTLFTIHKGYDNLVCDKQKINVNFKGCKKIYVLGCAEWGSACGKLQVGNDEYVNNLWLEFSDWFFCKMNRKNEWSGSAIDYEQNEAQRGLFCLDFELNMEEPISWIKFPSVGNMHIFGIKLLY